MIALLEWALQVAIRAFFLLLLAILLWFVWDAVMRLFNGPGLSFFEVALIVAIISVGVGGWGFHLLSRPAPAQ